MIYQNEKVVIGREDLNGIIHKIRGRHAQPQDQDMGRGHGGRWTEPPGQGGMVRAMEMLRILPGTWNDLWEDLPARHRGLLRRADQGATPAWKKSSSGLGMSKCNDCQKFNNCYSTDSCKCAKEFLVDWTSQRICVAWEPKESEIGKSNKFSRYDIAKRLDSELLYL